MRPVPWEGVDRRTMIGEHRTKLPCFNTAPRLLALCLAMQAFSASAQGAGGMALGWGITPMGRPAMGRDDYRLQVHHEPGDR